MTHQSRSTKPPVTRMPDARRSDAGDRIRTAPTAKTAATTPAAPSTAPHAGKRPDTAHPVDASPRATDTTVGPPAWVAVAERALNLREPDRQALRDARLVSQFRAFALSSQADVIAGLIADHPDMHGTDPGPGEDIAAGTAEVTVVSDGTLPSIPLATTLTPQQITAMIAAQDDPWAIDRDTGTPGRAGRRTISI